jgi:hypothetical protein
VNKIIEIIRKKPPLFLLISLGYLFLVGFIGWNIHPTTGTWIFITGGLFGVYFLDFAEEVFGVQPSPFRSVVFAGGLALVGVFITTSSGSMLASGLVLSLYLSVILRVTGEWGLHKHLNDWYRLIAVPVPVRMQLYFLCGFIVLFLIETMLFLRIV